MKIPKKPIGVGDVTISPLAKKYINSVLNSQRISYGPFSKKFEKKFAKLHKIKHAIITNSGTSALQVAVNIVKNKHGWQSNDEVIVPALGFVSTVNVVIQNNLKPVFADVDPAFFEIDPKSLEKKISKKTKAIIVTHIAGQPADMDPILKIAKKHSLKIIEDSCETVLARYKNKFVGSFSDISCFSTYSAHVLVTGVGGLICTNQSDIATKARSLINHGRDPAYTSIDDDKKNLKSIISKRFSFIDIGYSYRLTEFEAALGLANLKNLKSSIRKRIENANYLSKSLEKLNDKLQLPQKRENSDHVFMVYPIVLKYKKTKLGDLLFFLEKNMIETRNLFPLINQPVYKNLIGSLSDFPVAKNLLSTGFYIGCQESLTRKDLDYISQKFYEFFRD